MEKNINFMSSDFGDVQYFRSVLSDSEAVKLLLTIPQVRANYIKDLNKKLSKCICKHKVVDFFISEMNENYEIKFIDLILSDGDGDQLKINFDYLITCIYNGMENDKFGGTEPINIRSFYDNIQQEIFEMSIREFMVYFYERFKPLCMCSLDMYYNDLGNKNESMTFKVHHIWPSSLKHIEDCQDKTQNIYVRGNNLRIMQLELVELMDEYLKKPKLKNSALSF